MVILKNGNIYDGTGGRPFTGDVVVENGAITKITSTGGPVPVAETIDCTGLSITPGFIDAHSHNDFFAAREDNLAFFRPFIEQGVTSMVTGNCGFSAAGYLPGTPFNREIGGGLFTNHGADYSSFLEWNRIAGQNSPVNIVSLVGHGTVRISLNSMSSSRLSDAQLKQMEEILDRSLSEGAAGVSLGLMYEPGRYAPPEELEMAARVVKRHGKILSFHSRAMSRVSTSYSPPIGGRAHGLRAIDEVLDIARKTGVRTQLSHLIFVGTQSWTYVDEALRLLEQAAQEGIDIKFDMYAMDFGASIITVILPTWFLSLNEQDKKNGFTRLKLALEIGLTRKLLGFDFSDILVTNTGGTLPEVEGKRITEIARSWKMSPLAAYLSVVEKTDAAAEVLMFKYANAEIIEKLRRHPLALYMTDAWFTGRGIQNYAMYYNFPKFILLAMKAGTPVETAIHKMTGAVAERYGITDRGILKVGGKADITVFNPASLRFTEHREEPARGIEYVMINGRMVVRRGVFDEQSVRSAGQFISV